MASDAAKRQLANLRRLKLTEQVIYRPARPGLSPREITAMVDRPGSRAVMEARAEGFRVTALNDEFLGVPSDPRLSDAGTDRIDVAERRGGERTTRNIQRIADDGDPDFSILEVL